MAAGAAMLLVLAAWTTAALLILRRKARAQGHASIFALLAAGIPGVRDYRVDRYDVYQIGVFLLAAGSALLVEAFH